MYETFQELIMELPLKVIVMEQLLALESGEEDEVEVFLENHADENKILQLSDELVALLVSPEGIIMHHHDFARGLMMLPFFDETLIAAVDPDAWVESMEYLWVTEEGLPRGERHFEDIFAAMPEEVILGWFERASEAARLCCLIRLLMGGYIIEMGDEVLADALVFCSDETAAAVSVLIDERCAEREECDGCEFEIEIECDGCPEECECTDD